MAKKTKKPAKRVGKKAAKKAAKKAIPRKAAKKKTAPKKVAKKPVKKAAKKASKKAAPAKIQVKPSTTISPYLTFNGNCEEAFNFYKSVFGGNFTYIGRFKDMPPAVGQPPVPASQADKIMHIGLPISKETNLMGSDSSDEFGHATTIGNNFSISVNTFSQAEADRIFKGLSAGGKVAMPMAKTFWGSYFGMCTDKFDIQWMVSFEVNTQK